jgi:predicted DNA-binding transcriptional regulator YafY
MRTDPVRDTGQTVRMVSTSARLLQLVSLLTSRPWWSAAELAERLAITERTVRRDIERLRELDYPVEAVPGPGGGYRLGAGAAVPPVQLDADEAIAVAVCLRMAAAGSVRGIEDAAPRALAKLERLLPPRARSKLAAIEAATVPLAGGSDQVDADVLLTVAEACRAQERLRFPYVSRDGTASRRYVEPLRLVPAARRWYLVAFDRDRDGWRTFRLDRISRPFSTGERFEHDDPPDAAALVREALTSAPYRFVARVRIDAPHEEVARRVPPTVATLLAEPGGTTLLTSGADELGHLAGWLAMLGLDFLVLDPPELRDELQRTADRLHRAAAPPPIPAR